MFNKQNQSVLWFAMAVVFVALFLISGLLTPPVSQAGLPDRNTPTPTSESSKGDSDGGSSKPLLAHIELLVSPAPVGAWSVVQWQDPQGGWHDVEGWRSVLGSNGYQRWAVESKDFGTGPFRWQIRQGGVDGLDLSTSTSFTLPSGAGELVLIRVGL